VSGAITLRVSGFKAIHVEATAGLFEALDSLDGAVWDATISISPAGVILFIPALGRALGYMPAGGHYLRVFESLHPPRSVVWGSRQVPLAMTGQLAAHVIRRLLEWKFPPRGRGGPKRAVGWDDDREEFFARVLQEQRGEGGGEAKVTNAIAAVAAKDQGLFESAFDGLDLSSKLAAARRDYYRRVKEFEAVPAGAIPLGRIMAMRFELEDDPAE
jgi:hypothetical protein